MDKPFAACAGCPRQCGTEAQPYHYVANDLTAEVDVLVVAEAPVNDRYKKAPRPFDDDSGRIMRAAVRSMLQTDPRYRGLRVGFAYAVRCSSNQGDKDPQKAVLVKCGSVLHEQLATISQRRVPVLLLMGKSALSPFDIKAKKLADVSGRVLRNSATIPLPGGGTRTFDAVVTLSTKQLVTVPGLYPTFERDIGRALEVAVNGVIGRSAPASLEELTKDYRIPTTLEEVKQVCDDIINYVEGGGTAETWPISVDTETNTKFPHRDGLKILAVSFAWAPGKATAIGLNHPEIAYDWQEAVPHVLRVLACAKPKFLHNAKYDLKVFHKLKWELSRFVWDSMLAEHLIEEDKKGFYGLKPLTRTFFPSFAAYADTLQEILGKQEGDSQLENLHKALHATVTARTGKPLEHETEKQIEATPTQTDLFAALEKDTPPPTSKKARKKAAKKAEKKNKKNDDGGFEKIPLKTLLLYAAIDADMTRRLVLLQEARMMREQNDAIALYNQEARNKYRQFPLPQLNTEKIPVRTLARKTVFPVTPALMRIEYDGVRIDKQHLASLRESLTKAIDETYHELVTMSGRDNIKLSAPAEIARVLFEDGFYHPTSGERVVYSAEDIGRTATGKIQTTEKVMKFLTAKYKCPFAAKKLIYAKASKARDTFIANVETLSMLDGFIHTSYNQHGTTTGRLSSNDVNMQNIPKKLAGVNIKKIFTTTDDDLVFVNADAKGAEVRILTAYCKDPGLIASLKAGQDTHCFIASEIIKLVRLSPGAAEVLASMGLSDDFPLTYEDFFMRDETIKPKNKAYAEMLDKFRTAVKRVVFGILYGARAKKIAETIGISMEQAQVIIDMLFKMFPSIKAYMLQTQWELRTFGFVETFFGRRRRFNVPGAAKYLIGRAERQTVNFKIQSTSSDIVMGRLLAIENPLRDLGGRMLLTVHDSLGFEIKKKYVEQLPDFVETYLKKGAAEAHPWLPVDFAWDYEVGPSYGELTNLKTYLAQLKQKEVRNDAAEAYTEEEIRLALARAGASEKYSVV